MKLILDLVAYLLEKAAFWILFIGATVLKIGMLIILGAVTAFFFNR